MGIDRNNFKDPNYKVSTLAILFRVKTLISPSTLKMDHAESVNAQIFFST